MLNLLNLAMAFLVLGVIAWGAYWTGVPRFAIQISWMLSSIGILLLMISLITGRTADRVLAKNVPPAIE
jgi:uncharacterized membrane protein YtjA (UPF0391 family)